MSANEAKPRSAVKKGSCVSPTWNPSLCTWVRAALVLAVSLCLFAPRPALADEPRTQSAEASVETPPAPEPPPQSWLQRTWLPPRPPHWFDIMFAATPYPSTPSFGLDADMEVGPSVASGVHGTLTHCRACNIGSDADQRLHDVGLAYAYVGHGRQNYMVGGAFLLTHGLGLDSDQDRFGYGSMLVLRAGRLDGLRLDLGVGWVVTQHGHNGAFVLHNELQVPLLRTDDYQVSFEARSDFAILDPFFWIPSLGLRVRAGPVVVGARVNLMEHANSLMLILGYRRQ